MCGGEGGGGRGANAALRMNTGDDSVLGDTAAVIKREDATGDGGRNATARDSPQVGLVIDGLKTSSYVSTPPRLGR